MCVYRFIVQPAILYLPPAELDLLYKGRDTLFMLHSSMSASVL